MKLNVQLGARTYRIYDSDLWTEPELARTTWPEIDGHECVQRKVHDDERGIIVIRLDTGGMVRPHSRYFLK